MMVHYFMLCLSILGLVLFILKSRKLKLFRGHLFSNTVKIMLFISDTQYYVLNKLCSMEGSIHLLKIMGMLTSENVKLKRNIIWDMIELDWKEVNMTLNRNKINLPKSVTIKFRDKIQNQMYCQKRTHALSYYVKARLDMVYFAIQQCSRNSIRHARYSSRKWLAIWNLLATFSLDTFCVLCQRT